jgi:hypothetical protein
MTSIATAEEQAGHGKASMQPEAAGLTINTHLSSCDKREVLHWSRWASFYLLKVTLLYLTVTWILWAFPLPYDW